MKELDFSTPLNNLTKSNSKDKEISYLNTVGLYIIQKLREEDLKESKDSISIEETNSSSKLNEEELKDKLDIVELILNNRDILMNLEDFYEEDCQISLLNWALEAYKKFLEKKILCMKRNSQELNNDLLYKNNCLNNKAEILLFNILNIFEIFPIKPDDLKSLNFIEKLRVIKNNMKSYNLLLYKKIKKLIKFWKKMIKFFDSQKPIFDSNKKKLELTLQQKRLKEDCDTEKKAKTTNSKYPEFKEENENMSLNISLDETDSCDNKIKKKNVTWKNNEYLVEKIEFDPTNAPFEM